MSYSKDSIEFLPKPSIHNFIDLEGQQFHYLTVLGIIERIKRLRVNVWLCKPTTNGLTTCSHGMVGHKQSNSGAVN